MSKSILIVDDEKSFREFLDILFANEGMTTYLAKNIKESKEIIKNNKIDIILSDLIIGDDSGLALARWINQNSLDIPFILMTAYASSETAIESVRLGVYDYITKPFDTDDLLEMVKSVLTIEPKEEKCCKELDDIIGESESIINVKKTIKNIASSDSNVLITGESGTGKELVARAIHRLSNRNDYPFIAINCGAIPQDLLESEMFGYKKGAFTGADSDKLGFFQLANNGTIFLDEIAEMPVNLQVKLLRVLQENTILMLGSNSEIKVNVRVIAATNIDIESAVENNSFRKDLYYRLNVVNIDLPSLSERKSDIEILSRYFLKRYAAKMNKNIDDISYPVLQILQNYNFVGNVRELENIIERAVVLEKTNKILPSSLPENMLVDSKHFNSYDSLPEEIGNGVELEKIIENIEKKYIIQSLEKTEGNQSKAAKLLGLSLRIFRYKLEKYGIHFVK
jgi:two-component system response regulator PilR (NtrC family)